MLATNGIIELRASGQHGLDELLGRIVPDGFCYRMEGYAIVSEHFADIEMVFGISGEPIHLGDDERSDVAFFLSAKIDSSQEIFAVG